MCSAGVKELLEKKIPVIVDTDIGGDIDDVWALALLLKMPQIDIKLITTSVGDTVSRAKIVAKMLERADRTDIPIGIGLSDVNMNCWYKAWAQDYDLGNYPGKVYYDGVKAIVDTIMNSQQEVVIAAIAPLTNISAALEARPAIVKRSRIVGMLGSVYRGYDGKATVDKECNIVNDIPSAKKVFCSDWKMFITPLDTCGVVKLGGTAYSKIKSCRDPLVEAVLENYVFWILRPGFKPNPKYTFSCLFDRTSILFDTVVAYMIICTDLLDIEEIGLRISDDGYTVPDDSARHIRCALHWRSLPLFEKWITDTLTNEKKQPVISQSSRVKIVTNDEVRIRLGNKVGLHS